MKPTEQAIRQALMQTGDLLPTNEAAIAYLSETITPAPYDEATAAKQLNYIMDRLAGKGTPVKFATRISPVERASPASPGLLRAARNGEELPTEILEKMAKDRQAAEDS